MSVLDEILATKREEVARLVATAAEHPLQPAAGGPVRDFAAALRRPDGRLAVIAELKRRSPSKGDLAPDLDPARTAKAYAAGGAAALSVLTDGPYFGGSLDDLRAARAATDLPALRKDFTIHEHQLEEARAAGADAALLICAALPDDARLRALLDAGHGLGLAILVEAHDDAEIDRAVAAGARVVGVNSRSLATFAEDLSIAERLAARLPAEVVRVAESAIRSEADARRMADAGFDAVLVGEALVRADDPTGLVRAMAAHAVAGAPGARPGEGVVPCS